MSYHIRRARPAEAAELTELVRAAKASWGYPADWLEAWRDELAIPPGYVAEHHVFVADTGNGLAGVAALERDGEACELEHLWVAPARQGLGIGAALVRQALDLARDAGHASVRVVSDPHAAGFYERLGGRVTGSVPRPMPGVPERVLIVLELAV